MQAEPDAPPAVDLDLEKVLGKMPAKSFTFKDFVSQAGPLALPNPATTEALDRVLR